MADLNVRHLQTIDVFRMAKIIQKCTSGARASLLSVFSTIADDNDTPANDTVDAPSDEVAAPEKPASSKAAELGFALFEAAVDQESAIKEFFAGLVNMKVSDFDKTPYDTMIIIIERVFEQDDLPAFLSRALGLATKFTGGSST